MIVFNLLCKKCNFEFEGWFDHTNDFNNQNKKKIINCPSCNSHLIKKALMAPNLTSKSNSKKILKEKQTIANKIANFKKIIEKNFDYVGDNFTEEAKKIKYGEKNDRPIYGEANIEQTKELLDEDIDIVPLPWSNEKKIN